MAPIARPQPLISLDEYNKVDPYLAHREYLAGTLPDLFAKETDGQGVCHLKDRDNGKLLSRIKLRSPGTHCVLQCR